MPSQSNLQPNPSISKIQDLSVVVQFWIGFDWYQSL